MNVGALRRLLDDPSIKDNMLVVVPFADHQYRHAYANISPAIVENDKMFEAYDDPTESSSIDVLVFR